MSKRPIILFDGQAIEVRDADNEKIAQIVSDSLNNILVIESLIGSISLETPNGRFLRIEDGVSLSLNLNNEVHLNVDSGGNLTVDSSLIPSEEGLNLGSSDNQWGGIFSQQINSSLIVSNDTLSVSETSSGQGILLIIGTYRLLWGINGAVGGGTWHSISSTSGGSSLDGLVLGGGVDIGHLWIDNEGNVAIYSGANPPIYNSKLYVEGNVECSEIGLTASGDNSAPQIVHKDDADTGVLFDPDSQVVRLVANATTGVNVSNNGIYIRAAETTDAEMENSTINFYLDDTEKSLIVKVKRSDGSIVSGYITLA